MTDDLRLRRLANQLLSSVGPEGEGGPVSTLARLLKDVTNALEADGAALCVAEPDAPLAELILTVGSEAAAEPHLGALPLYSETSEPWPGVTAMQGPPPDAMQAIATGGALVRETATAEADAGLGFPASGPRLGCPIPGSGAAAGALLLRRAGDAGQFTAMDAALLAAVAGQVALQLERARLDREGEANERREAALAELAESCLSADSHTVVIESALDLIHRVLEADGSRVWLLDPSGRSLRLAGVRGIPQGAGQAGLEIDREELLAVRAMSSPEPVLLDDANAIQAAVADVTARHAGFTHACGFPLIAQDRTYGALTCFSRRMSHASADDVRFVKSVADLVAVACATYEAQIERDHSDAVFRSAVTNSPVPLLVYESAGRIIGSSRRVWELLGYDPRAVRDIDQWFQLAFPEPAYRESLRRRVEERQEGAVRRSSANDVEVTCADGSVRVWTLMHEAVDHPDRPTQHFLAALDVTEERQAQADLRQATKMEAVGRLAGGIAHDFNNLLTVIAGYVDIALALVDAEDKVKKPLAEIALASEKAGQLTEKLLAFSRQRKPEPRAVDLGNVVRNLMSMVRPLIGEGIEVDLDLDDQVAPVRIDRGSLEQVLINMFVNARDAMGEQGRVSLRTLAVPHGEIPPRVGGPAMAGPHALLLMSDTGHGMPPEVLSRIFEPFFTTKQVGVGTGLGLAGAYATITQAGGDVRVVSAVDRGSTFGILLPALAGVATRVEEAKSDAPPGGTETVLVVEDRVQVRDLAAAILEALGYTVITAEDGVDALSVVEATHEPIDILLTDVIMPRMGGVELASRLQRRQPGLPVLFMSGYPGKDLTAASLPVGEQSILRKPFTSSVLGHRIREALDERG